MNETDPSHQLMERIQALVRRFSIVERADISCCGMTVAQAAALGTLRRQDGRRLGELGRRLGITNSTLTRNLERLRRAGLVETSRDPADGRATLVRLSARGRSAAAEVAQVEARFARAITDELGPRAAGETLKLMDRLLAAIRRASDDCCPGAFDHLMIPLLWGKGEREDGIRKQT